MSMLAELLYRITRDPDCAILPAAGQPVVDTGHTVPEEVRRLSSLCGGCIIGRWSFYEARIVAPGEVVLANDVILVGEYAAITREKNSDDPLWTWYVIAEVESGNRLSIDFGLARNGRCYDSFWHIYGQVGNMPVIAASLTELLQQLYENKGNHLHWLEPGFETLGDAYVAT
jgi:hypothetical protein